MRYNSSAALVCAATVPIFFSRAASAAEPSCAERITRENIVACALAGSSTLRIAQEEEQRSVARLEGASVLLPRNPEIAGRLLRRTSLDSDAETLNWDAELSQELEIGGQRSTRIDAAEKAQRAASASTDSTRRTIAAEALASYFEVLSASESLRLTERLARVAEELRTWAEARAEQGVGSRIDAELAYAAAMQILRARAEAERRRIERLGALEALLGLDPLTDPLSEPRTEPKIEGGLIPLEPPTTDAKALLELALSKRPDLRQRRAEHAAALSKIGVLERERIPNVTISGVVERDGFDELVVGGGLSLPIPMPSPLGHSNRAEIAEAEAEARRAEAELTLSSRALRIEVLTALGTYESLRREASSFDADRQKQAEETLIALGEEIAAGRLPARDALAAQQSLLELLQAEVEARRELCLASVELIRVTGLPFEGEAR